MILGLTKRVLVVDVESSSPVDLKAHGQYIYWDDPGTRTLMIGTKWLQPSPGWNNQAPMTDLARVLDLEQSRGWMPPALVAAIEAPPEEVMLAAANAPFDQAALRQMGFDTPDEKWIDVLVMAYTSGFAGRLNDVLKQTPLGIEKNPDGTRCITEFCVKQTPWHENPIMWDRFLSYCRDDADVEERLLRWCLQWLDTDWLAPSVRKIHEQDLSYRRINRRGIPVDRSAVKGALAIKAQETERLMDALRAVTGLENPNSVAQLQAWCREQGSTVENLQKATVRDEIAASPPGPLRSALELRAELGKTSVKKFDALDRTTGKGDRLRGGWQFYGASRTGRVAGRVLNPANLARPRIGDPDTVVEWITLGDAQYIRDLFPEKPVLDTLSSCIRASLKAPDGKLWCVADLTSIESVGGAWMAGCDTILDIFFAGRDTYKTFAAATNGIPYEEVTKEQRGFAKPAVLGAGFGISGPGLEAYAVGYGVEMHPKEAERQIIVFREEYHEIVHHWRQLQDAAIAAVLNGGQVFSVYAAGRVLSSRVDERTGRTYRGYSYKPWPRIDYWCDGNFLFCRLPSGRYLSYYRPEVEINKQIYKDGEPWFKTDSLSYMGTDQKSPGNQWQRIATRGAKLFENNDQALCRDAMWNGLEKADHDPDFDVIGDVYDEVLTLIDETRPELLNRLVEYMTTRPPWADERFFLGADGYTAPRYRKD